MDQAKKLEAYSALSVSEYDDNFAVLRYLRWDPRTRHMVTEELAQVGHDPDRPYSEFELYSIAAHELRIRRTGQGTLYNW